MPGGTFKNVKAPLPSVSVVLEVGPRKLTVAPGIGALDSSETVPVTDDVVVALDCAYDGTGAARSRTTAKVANGTEVSALST